MATVLVSNIVVFSDSTGHGNQSHLVYAPVQQRWWLFYIDTKTATGVKVLVSSSNDLTTASWGNPGANTGGVGANQSPAFPTSRALSANDQRNMGVLMIPNSINSNDAVHVSVGIGTGSTNAFTEHIRAKFTSTASITWETWGELSIPISGTWDAVKGNCLDVDTQGFINEAGATLNGSQDAQVRTSTNADTGSTWTNGFGSPAIIDNSATFEVNTYGLARLASGAAIAVYDNGGAAEPNSTGLRYNKDTGTGWPGTGSAVTGNGTTSQDQNDWCLCFVDTTHIYAFRRTASAVDCRKFDGNTTWSTPASTLPSETTKAGSGLFASSDGTSLWLFVLDNTGNNAVKYCKGSTASGTISFDGSWTTLETAGSTARNFISGNPVVSNSQIGMIYTAVNGSNFDIVLSALNLAAGSTFAPKQSSYLLVHL